MPKQTQDATSSKNLAIRHLGNCTHVLKRGFRHKGAVGILEKRLEFIAFEYRSAIVRKVQQLRSHRVTSPDWQFRTPSHQILSMVIMVIDRLQILTFCILMLPFTQLCTSCASLLPSTVSLAFRGLVVGSNSIKNCFPSRWGGFELLEISPWQNLWVCLNIFPQIQWWPFGGYAPFWDTSVAF